jgi:hypothetical protein
VLATHFAELTTTRSVSGWKETQGAYSQEDEIRGMDVHLGIEGTNSNGQGEGKDENLNMEKNIRNLQKDVQSYKDDNERLMKTKEQQEDFNMKLMQILDKIEKKLDKENGSRKSVSHRSPDEKGRSRSASIHHPCSPRNSNRRATNISISSPLRKHQKRYGMDELRGEMNKIKPPTFDGEHKKDEDVKTWLLGMRKYFQLHNYSSHAEGRILSTSSKEMHPCGGINLCRCNTSKRKMLLGRNSRSILKRNT